MEIYGIYTSNLFFICGRKDFKFLSYVSWQNDFIPVASKIPYVYAYESLSCNKEGVFLFISVFTSHLQLFYKIDVL